MRGGAPARPDGGERRHRIGPGQHRHRGHQWRQARGQGGDDPSDRPREPSTQHGEHRDEADGGGDGGRPQGQRAVAGHGQPALHEEQVGQHHPVDVLGGAPQVPERERRELGGRHLVAEHRGPPARARSARRPPSSEPRRRAHAGSRGQPPTRDGPTSSRPAGTEDVVGPILAVDGPPKWADQRVWRHGIRDVGRLLGRAHAAQPSEARSRHPRLGAHVVAGAAG